MGLLCLKGFGSVCSAPPLLEILPEGAGAYSLGWIHSSKNKNSFLLVVCVFRRSQCPLWERSPLMNMDGLSLLLKTRRRNLVWLALMRLRYLQLNQRPNTKCLRRGLKSEHFLWCEIMAAAPYVVHFFSNWIAIWDLTSGLLFELTSRLVSLAGRL